MLPGIRLVPHKEIDKACWDENILHACNSLLYARSDYLDAMSPGWDALILGDYEALMPVTWRKKMGIRYACQPAFVQQLGIFYAHEKQRIFIPAFLKEMALEFRLAEIFLNYHNQAEGIIPLHQNFILDLNKSYAETREGYSKNLLNSLNKAAKFDLQYLQSEDSETAIKYYRDQYANRMHIRKEDFEQFNLLAKTLLKKGNAIVREVRSKNNELLAISLLLKDNKRLYNITSATLPAGRSLEANHFLMDQLICEFSGSGLLLDFEGSDLPGVAKFYKKFGPINQPYAFWKINRLPAILRLVKK